MLSQLRFYTQHSLNDLKVNGQRTFFALLCIAAGVAAIVSLQTLAAMITNTLTSSLQTNNRGDLQVRVDSPDDRAEEEIMQRYIDAGLILRDQVAFGGQQGSSYRFTQAGIDALQGWLDENAPGARLTYRQPLANFLEIFTGSGTGTVLRVPGTETELRSVTPVMVDAAAYPLVGEIRTLEGQLLAEVLRAPDDLVLGQRAAQQLNAQVGDTLEIQGVEGTFIVRGIVADEAEVRNPQQDFLAALYGFYMVDMRSRERFGDNPIQATTVFVQFAPGSDVTALKDALRAALPYTQSTSVEDLRRIYSAVSENVTQLVTVMGLISLLLGSIGIVNTMQVIVRRRTREVAVLKTLGLQPEQVTLLFLVQAFIMGVLGSIFGILLGWAMVFVIRGVAEGLLGQPLAFAIAPQAALGGFVVGTLVTTVFGFLPTLAAGQVRPGVVLRPDDAPVPRAGRLRSLGALLLMIAAVSIVAQSIVGNLLLAFVVITAAFLAAGLIYLLLYLLIWLVGRAMPSLGLPDLRIAMREMLAARSRGATTLLALVVGVFSLSIITLLADSVSATISQTFLSGYNIFIQVGGGEAGLQRVESALAELDGPVSYDVSRSFNLDLRSVVKADGTALDEAALVQRLGENANLDLLRADANARDLRGADGQPITDEALRQRAGERSLRQVRSVLGSVDAIPLEAALPEREFVAGGAPDVNAEIPEIVLINQGFIANAGLEVGDVLVYEISSGGVLGIGARRDEVRLRVAGLATLPEQLSFATSNAYAWANAFPEGQAASQIRITAQVPDDQVGALRRAIAAQPLTFVIETETINRLFSTLIGQFTAFPLLTALLGLVVGGIVIANSVALSTMERRREIAILKSVGLQRERVLAMLLLENGVLGLIGGLLGVGLGLIGLLVLLANAPVSSPIPVGAALLLMLLCVGVALVAALTTAWGASGEKPLNVLRYE